MYVFFAVTGVGDGGQGARAPPKIREKNFRAIFM